MNQASIACRPIYPDDESFLRQVYASTRLEELAPLGWSAVQQDMFLRQQFDAQHYHYQAHYDDASFQLILCDGNPAGRLYVARWPDEIRVIDIALLPEYRHRGIGGRLLRDLLNEAARDGKRVTIHVEKFNPALRLYQRLNFVPIADHGVYWFMQWSPERAVNADSALPNP